MLPAPMFAIVAPDSSSTAHPAMPVSGETFASAIFIGVLGGIASWMLIQAASALFWNTVLPFYQRKVYRGVDLNGTWVGEQDRPGRGNFKFELALSQTGHRLSGTLRTTDKYPDGRIFTDSLVAEGMISDGSVLLTYHGTAGRIGLGAVLLQVRDAGDTLMGAVMFLKAVSSEVGADEDLVLTRRA